MLMINYICKNCKNNNKNEDFIINQGTICARLDNTLCLEGTFDLHPKILEPKEYDSLTCSSKFAKRGYKCCSNQNARVEKVDNIGNWAKENGKWCGIGYTRCSFELLGYHCCSSVNPEVVDTDELGQWGFEDDEKCGIGEIKRPNGPYRIRNVKTNKCLVTKANDKNKIYVGDCSEYNDNNKYTQWYWNNTQIVSAQYDGKYMYVMNYKNAVLGSDSDVLGQDNVYSHFEFNNDGTFCIKYDGKQYCLRQTNENDKEINFELLSNNEHEMFQWRIENFDRSDYNVITSIDWYPYNPDKNFNPIPEEPSSQTYCPFESLGYSCCSDPNAVISYTDDTGDWSVENNEWCIIYKCWSEESLGYPCCSDPTTKVDYYTDDTGSWDIENGGWCDIININSNTQVSTPTPTCSSKFAELGYPCCEDPNTKVEYTDATGSWGTENGGWCGVSDDNTNTPVSTPAPTFKPECPFQDYPCCSSENTNVVATDNAGDWGSENGEWCHIINSKHSISTTTTATNIPIVTNYRCGSNFNNMKCNPGYCCSNKGYCGATMDYCGTGCQSEFGDCKCGPKNSNHI